jgi:hypothetical protein
MHVFCRAGYQGLKVGGFNLHPVLVPLVEQQNLRVFRSSLRLIFFVT